METTPTRYYITTSIPYVNAAPHLGHALEFVLTDCLARYHRLHAADTWFLSGTDDNSLKNVIAAEREGVPVHELVDRCSRAFLGLMSALNISNDDFIRTSLHSHHRDGAYKLWAACAQHGDIYKRDYAGLYCTGCESFYTEDELTADGRCPEHDCRPELVREENYFFRLSRYQDQLAEAIDSGRFGIIPESRRKEARAFIARGLQDFSISRSRTRARSWGIAVPGDPDQVMYVWFDALTNYISALGYASDAERYHRFWLENPQRVHVIGKGILRFHAVYWPAMLLSAGEPIPSHLIIHGYLTVGGQKISKSLGNAVDPLGLVQRYGLDAVRYWLLRGVPPTDDADYTDAKLERLYAGDLADDLGNLLNRVASMLHRYRNGRLPGSSPAAPARTDQDLATVAAQAIARLHAAMDGNDPQTALRAIWQLVGRANRYIEETAPWALWKAERDGDLGAGRRLNAVFYELAESLRIIAEALRPSLPHTAEEIARRLGQPLSPSGWCDALRWGQLAVGRTVAPAQPIFPKTTAVSEEGH